MEEIHQLIGSLSYYLQCLQVVAYLTSFQIHLSAPLRQSLGIQANVAAVPLNKSPPAWVEAVWISAVFEDALLNGRPSQLVFLEEFHPQTTVLFHSGIRLKLSIPPFGFFFALNARTFCPQ